jgi:hypothetical protein
MTVPETATRLSGHKMASGNIGSFVVTNNRQGEVLNFLAGPEYDGSQKPYGFTAIPGISFMAPDFILLDDVEAERKFGELWRNGLPPTSGH